MSKFKVGDQVIIVNGRLYSGFESNIGEVVEIRIDENEEGCNIDIMVRCLMNYGVHDLRFNEDDLKLLNRDEDDELGEFKVGDKVKVINNVKYNGIYEVVELDNDDSVGIGTSSGGVWIYIEDIELVTREDDEVETYNTLEIIVIMADNPEKQFKNITTNVVVKIVDGDLDVSDGSVLNLYDFWKEVAPQPHKYWLKDVFYNKYLNYNIKFGEFSISDKEEFQNYKTKFTDEDIEDLEIPIERFEKISIVDN